MDTNLLHKGKEKLPLWSRKEYLQNAASLLLKLTLRQLLKLCFLIPIKKNRIVVYSLKQHGFSCNLKYLTKYIQSVYPGKYEILWIVKRLQHISDIQGHGYSAALLHSWKHLQYRLRAEIVLTNDEFYLLFPKRKGQIYVNTWHGAINYKKIGYEGLDFANKLQKKTFALSNPAPDIFVSGSRSFSETTACAFGFKKDIFLACGLPRNDVFFQDTSQLQSQVKKKLNIPEKAKILLYAPTFRTGNNRIEIGFSFGRLRDSLQARFGGDWFILIRQHYFIEQSGFQMEPEVLDVTEYNDMQELLLCADCLISDYSSCMWDFSLSEKPCFSFAPDLARYDRMDRSFFVDPSAWPYSVCKTASELYTSILNFDFKDYQEKVRNHHRDMGAYDTGHACKQLMDEIIKSQNRGKQYYETSHHLRNF